MRSPRSILEVNTRVWLRELGEGRPLSLAEVPDSYLAEWTAQGFDAVWLLGVWLPSEHSRREALEHSELHAEYSRALPDWTERDIGGSPFAIRGYEVNPELGGPAALAAFRSYLRDHGLRLILDFISNHTAADHPWVYQHPDWYIRGTENDLAHDPSRWFWAQTADGPHAIAHGRDPYYPPWTDTAQLDYHNPALQKQMRAELARLATVCDGLRCDMAMLVLSTMMEQTWGSRPSEFWPHAIAETRRVFPEFCFIAEVYWGLDEPLREMGFDLTYDRELMDDIVARRPLSRERFNLPDSEHRRRLRFLENHDEPRIASRMDPHRQQSAAAWVFGLPSTRLLLHGQLEGHRVRLPVQLLRAPREAINEDVRARYAALLPALNRRAVREGRWQLLTARPAWFGNESYPWILGQGYDLDDEHVRIFVNASDTRAQCWVSLGLGPLDGREVVLRDQLSTKVYVRDGVELMLRGLYLDLEPRESHLFECAIRPAHRSENP